MTPKEIVVKEDTAKFSSFLSIVSIDLTSVIRDWSWVLITRVVLPRFGKVNNVGFNATFWSGELVVHFTIKDTAKTVMFVVKFS